MRLNSLLEPLQLKLKKTDTSKIAAAIIDQMNNLETGTVVDDSELKGAFTQAELAKNDPESKSK